MNIPKEKPTMARDFHVAESDLLKIHDALLAATKHHTARDESNGYLHLATQTRLSPLTSELSAALDRVKAILES
jgi:hypothetical protein